MSYEYTSVLFGNEEEDENYETSKEFNLKELTIYAIDCRPSMLEADQDGDVPLLVTLKSIRAKIVDRIDSRPNDQIGIILFGTTEKNNAQDKDHVYILQPIDLIDAPRIKELDLLINNINLVKDRYGSSDAVFPFSDLLWVCSDIIANANAKQYIRRIIIITNNEDPTDGNAHYRKTAIQRARDLKDSGTEIILFGLKESQDACFDPNLFYSDIVVFPDNDDKQEEKDEFDDRILSSIGSLKDLFDKIKTIQTSARSEFRLPFEIGPNLTIGVRGYNMVLEQKIGTPKYYFAEGEQTQEVKSVTRWKCLDTNEFLTPIDIKKAYSYGGQDVVFTEDDVAAIQTVNQPGLLVLGFRDIAFLKSHYQVAHPYFIYPDESQYRGSKSAFFLLLNSMYQKEKMAICSFVRRVNTIPKLVALLPQPEKLDELGNQVDPPGFQLIILPYADEIRQVPPHAEVHDYQEAADTMKSIIHTLKIRGGYDPAKYHNPYLVNHKNMIQRAALDTDPQEQVDNCVPNYELIESELSDEIDAFKRLVGLDTLSSQDILDSQAQSQARKRGASSSGSAATASEGQPAKKLKEMTIAEHWKSGTLEKVTNPSLKEFLISVNIHPKKLKKDLIDQVDGYLKVKAED
ncbi:SPOC like C-terminal domain-containing protein [Mucor lusitanicus]|uniref:ATP-dependent DNA helicase II subunit 1 n=1 Tax=Mucor circinelloides f. lusitanicus TaxID=29924 RepID=A0A8H4BNN6_MUCCL|nr:SPOC like C-terminal domain-containing protein [Mucor lusitanicus]